MQTDDQNRAPPTGERVEARDRLARQIGRLLAHEWLRNRATSPPDTSAAATISDDNHPKPSTATSDISSNAAGAL